MIAVRVVASESLNNHSFIQPCIMLQLAVDLYYIISLALGSDLTVT